VSAVDLAKAREAIHRLVAANFHKRDEDDRLILPRFSIPRREDDDDAVLYAAIDELEALRASVADVARVPRLLDENRCLMNEAAAMRDNLRAAQARGTELIDYSREGRRLFREYAAICDEAKRMAQDRTMFIDAPSWAVVVARSDEAFAKLAEWAARAR